MSMKNLADYSTSVKLSADYSTSVKFSFLKTGLGFSL